MGRKIYTPKAPGRLAIEFYHNEWVGEQDHFLLESLAELVKQLPPLHTVADIGAGSGAFGLGLFANSLADHVVLADNNKRSVEVLYQNIISNGCVRCEAIHSNVWSNFGEHEPFDLVVAHLPFEDSSAHSYLVQGTTKYLKKGGHLVVYFRDPTSEEIKDSNFWMNETAQHGLKLRDIVNWSENGFSGMLKQFGPVRIRFAPQQALFSFYVYQK